jgi:hypothetical protein
MLLIYVNAYEKGEVLWQGAPSVRKVCEHVLNKMSLGFVALCPLQNEDYNLSGGAEVNGVSVYPEGAAVEDGSSRPGADEEQRGGEDAHHRPAACGGRGHASETGWRRPAPRPARAAALREAPCLEE